MSLFAFRFRFVKIIQSFKGDRAGRSFVGSLECKLPDGQRKGFLPEGCGLGGDSLPAARATLQEVSFVPLDNEQQGLHPTPESEWEDFSGQQAEAFADIIAFQGD